MVKLPISEGIGPVKLFPCKFKLVKLTSSPIAGGIEPSSSNPPKPDEERSSAIVAVIS